MKTNFENSSLDNNRPIHIYSVLHPAKGYVAKPKKNTSGFKEDKLAKKIKGLPAGVGYIALPKEPGSYS